MSRKYAVWLREKAEFPLSLNPLQLFMCHFILTKKNYLGKLSP